MKICATCKISKEIDEFGIDKSNKDGHSYHCKICRSKKEAQWRIDHPEGQKERTRKYKEKRKEFYDSSRGIISSRKAHLKRMFNLTLDEYQLLSEKQENLCAICRKPETTYRNKVLSVDHCHDTNKIRGLLCNTCNRALGLFGDNIENLKSAVEYLQNFKNKIK